MPLKKIKTSSILNELPHLPNTGFVSALTSSDANSISVSFQVTTSGFRWNVVNETLSFGKLVSTSNEFQVDTDFAQVKNPENPILFTLQMRPEV